MPLVEKTDEELMAAYQKGTEDAFRILYSRHSGKVYGYLRSKCLSEQEASDLFQEVFVKIHRSKHLYNQSLPALPWIFSVTRSVMLDGHRKKVRRKEVFDCDLDTFSTEEKEDPRMDLVGTLTQELPPQQRMALQMRYIEEKTFEEIAEQLQTSPVNVRQILSRSIRNLREWARKGDKP